MFWAPPAPDFIPQTTDTVGQCDGWCRRRHSHQCGNRIQGKYHGSYTVRVQVGSAMPREYTNFTPQATKTLRIALEL